MSPTPICQFHFLSVTVGHCCQRAHTSLSLSTPTVHPCCLLAKYGRTRHSNRAPRLRIQSLTTFTSGQVILPLRMLIPPRHVSLSRAECNTREPLSLATRRSDRAVLPCHGGGTHTARARDARAPGCKGKTDGSTPSRLRPSLSAACVSVVPE